MPAKITLSVQVEYIGRVDAFADGWGGKASGLGRLEGFTLSSDAPAWPLHVTCQAILPDGSAAPPVAGGQYCGTGRGAVPLHGFIVKISDEAGDLADITYEGIFQDGYRSGLLRPGSVCTSPENAALLAMRVNATPPADGLREGAIVRPRYPGEPPLKHVPGIVPAQLSRPPVAEPDDIWAEEMPEVTLTAHIGGRGDVAADADGWSARLVTRTPSKVSAAIAGRRGGIVISAIRRCSTTAPLGLVWPAEIIAARREGCCRCMASWCMSRATSRISPAFSMRAHLPTGSALANCDLTRYALRREVRAWLRCA
jgi:hypothetical protein